jgi:hypothetical protein
MRSSFLAAVAACCLLVGNAHATVVIKSLGTSAPPSKLSTYALTAFAADPTADGTSVTSAPGPSGNNIDFAPALTKVTIGDGWATWSNGYTSSVYTCLDCTTATITLPAQTRAFYLYAEPEEFATFNITVTTDSGATLTEPVAGQAGAVGFGISGDAGESLMTVTVAIPAGADGFAIGEFGINVGPAILPPPLQPIPTVSPWALLALALLVLGLGIHGLRTRRTV